MPILWNASRREVCIFLTLVALWIAHRSSLVESCITTATSPSGLTAAVALHNAFMVLSLLGRSADLWEPTNMTGTGVSTMKLTAAELKDMVSVPWVTITPAAPSLISL